MAAIIDIHYLQTAWAFSDKELPDTSTLPGTPGPNHVACWLDCGESDDDRGLSGEASISHVDSGCSGVIGDGAEIINDCYCRVLRLVSGAVLWSRQWSSHCSTRQTRLMAGNMPSTELMLRAIRSRRTRMLARVAPVGGVLVGSSGLKPSLISSPSEAPSPSATQTLGLFSPQSRQRWDNPSPSASESASAGSSAFMPLFNSWSSGTPLRSLSL